MGKTSSSKPNRRVVNSMLMAASASPLLPRQESHAQTATPAVRPFRVDIPQARIDRILARVREADRPVDPDALVVRAAMPKRVHHPAERRDVDGPAIEADDATDATHGSGPPAVPPGSSPPRS